MKASVSDWTRPGWRRGCLERLLLTAIVLVAYSRLWHAGFIWDDSAHVTISDLRSLHGLARIWFELGATQQYYPVLHSAFWIEHRLWGDDPFWYHLLNVGLQVAVACLLLQVLRRLAVPGAFLGAALFAVHPVGVESVAWISEQKNTLSAVFYLLAALAYLRYDRERRMRWYGLGLCLFLLALLSKSVTATLPAALLVVIWWQRGRLAWKSDVLPLAVWLALGVTAGVVTASVERAFIGASGAAFQMGPVDRLLVAGRALWFYLGKIFWPRDLMFIYPRWIIDATRPTQYMFPAAAIGILAAFWAIRKRSRGPLAGGLLFAGTLFPALGFISAFPFIYSFIADHFQYLAAAIVLAALAAVFARMAADLSPAGRFAAGTAAACLVAGLASLTWRQCAMYADMETLWRTTIARNPACWMAYNNLAVDLVAHGHPDEAIADSQASLKIEPDNAAAYTNIGDAWREKGQLEEAFSNYERALKIRPRDVVAHINFGNALLQGGRASEAIVQFQDALAINPSSGIAHANLGDALLQTGRTDSAIGEYERALRGDSENAEAQVNLGIALERSGRTEDALVHYRKAVQLEPKNVKMRCDLGLALSSYGHAEESVGQYEAALRFAPDDAAAHNGLGIVLARLGRLPEAIRQYQDSARLNPGDPNPALNLGAIYFRGHHLPEAIEEYERALQLQPANANAENSLGLALVAVGRSGDAIEHYRRALRENPNYAAAHCNLGVALGSAGQNDLAQQEFEAALKVDDRLPDAHYNLGIMLALKHRWLDAIAHFEAAVRLRPDFADAELDWGRALQSLGRSAEANIHLDNATRLQPPGEY